MNKSRVIPLALIAVLLALGAGYFLGRRGSVPNAHDTSSATVSAETKPKVLYWKAPMDPNFRGDKPGKSPMGMELVPVYANDSNASGDSDVRISPDVVNNLGVRTALVAQGSVSQQLLAVGYVGYDEDTITSINTRADGWIEKLAVKSAGDTVRAGQLLFELFSPKLATAEREYLTALASGSQSLIAASGERMRSLGFTVGQIRQLKRTRKVSDRVARYAESSGIVMSLGVSEGAYVMPATQIMKLADLHSVWVMAEVEGSDAGLLHVGQKAVAEFDAFPGLKWHGAIDYVYPDLSAMTRTVKVRVRFANSDLQLQPNMYARVTIQSQPQLNRITIPTQALIRTGQGQRVIVALGDGRFDVCPVQAGFSSGDRVDILKGLQPGQRVVTSAQFMIDSEANVNAAALRLGEGRSGCRLPASATAPAGNAEDQTDDDMSAMDMSSKAMSTAQPTQEHNGSGSHANPDHAGSAMQGMPMDHKKQHSPPPTKPAGHVDDAGQQP